MAKEEIAKSGLLPIKFTARGHRALHFDMDENLLVVESPFGDKANLKRLGCSWHPSAPKGWAWYFTVPNLNMLIDKIPFNELDPKIEELAKEELARIDQLDNIRKAALRDDPICLRVPGVKPPEGVSLYNYQKLGIQFGSLVERGFLLGDEMGLGKCLVRDVSINIKGIGNIPLEEVWDKYSKPSTSTIDSEGEWRTLSAIRVLGMSNRKAKFQKAVRIYREKVKRISQIKLQDGSVLKAAMNHALFTDMGWKKIKDIKPKEWVLVNKIIEDDFCDSGISKNQAYFLAWQIAEGHENRNTQLRITQKDKEILEELKILFSSFRLSKNGGQICHRKDGTSHYLQISSKLYRLWMDAEFSDYRWGALSGDKVIPRKIVNAKAEVIKVFLQAYFEAEGCCNKDNIEVSSKSEKIIRSLHYMLRRLGVIGVVSNKTINTPKWGDSLYWKITIGGKYARTFQKQIGFLSTRKNDKLNNLCAKPENTNLGNSVPCKKLLQKLMSLSGLTNRLAGMESSVYVSDKSTYQNPSIDKLKHIIESVRSCLNDGLPDIGRSRWSKRYASIEESLKIQKDEIECVLKQLESMIFEDFVWMQVESIEKEKYNDYVYDLEIDGEHNYTADMVISHNSLQAIGIALWRKKTHGAKKCLVIAPASLKYNWKEEFEFWTNEEFTIVDGTPDKRDQQWNEGNFFTVVNPELIIRDFEDATFLQTAFDMIIVDEIHMFKNWKSKRSKFAKKLKIKDDGLRIGLSGTPIDGRLEDLHSIFEFLIPGLFTSRGKFLDRYAIRNEWNAVVGYLNVEEVRDTIKPFFLRRLKKDVAKQLPEKIFKNIYVELSPDERKIYNAIKDQSHEITEEALAITTVLRARQFCNAPVLVDEYPEFGSKFAACIEALEEIIANGHKVLIFSMFEQMVEKLYVEFENNGWKSLKITGRTSKKDRPAIARRFNEDENIDICVMNEAGSTGLNFQGASYVFHYDDNWSPAIMKQRTDRAHRITTDHTVTVINFICLNTIEDHVRETLKKKDDLSADAIGDDVNDVCAIKTLSGREALKLL